MDMLAEQKQKNEAERKKLFKHIHDTYDPILKTFTEFVGTPEGEAALRKLQEDTREKAIAEYREKEQTSRAEAAERQRKRNSFPQKKFV
jgi:predicted ArsR family transcriptional regulator